MVKQFQFRSFFLIVTSLFSINFIEAQSVAQMGDGSNEYIIMDSKTLESREDYEVNSAN